MQNTNTRTHDTTIKQVDETTCCIVGGGPAGMMLAYMLARKGVQVTLLEAHMDFDRDFRGDTLHPSVMENLSELGLADKLLQLRHAEMDKFEFDTSDGSVTMVDLSYLHTRYPYITIIEQARFLAFLAEEARRYPEFHLVMGAQVDELIEEDGVIRGVRYQGHDGRYELRAVLTVATDGRFSRIRKLAGFTPIQTSLPIDVLWFRLSKNAGDPDMKLGGRFVSHQIAVVIDRFDYYQIGYIIPKGGYQKIRQSGLPQLRASLALVLPEVAHHLDELQEWKQISVLTVESNRLPRWSRPGLLLIGDAAHVMSPVAGLGINYAIQDAVVTANLLGSKLRYGIVSTRELEEVQRRRELPTRFIQTVQALMLKQIMERAITSQEEFTIPPLFQRIIQLRPVRTITANLIGHGLWAPHIS